MPLEPQYPAHETHEALTISRLAAWRSGHPNFGTVDGVRVEPGRLPHEVRLLRHGQGRLRSEP